MNLPTQPNIAIIGLGYVGLPLAAEFGKTMNCIGFDISQPRIDALRNGVDSTLELSAEDLQSSQFLSFTSDSSELQDCDIYIVTVPTPIDSSKRPNLTPLEKASALVGSVLAKNNVVIYESTVYPGCTEEVCIPILEAQSGLSFNQDFFAGYSPERINPGDKEHTVTNITKVTSGSTPEAADYIDQLYRKIVTAGTHRASSIKVAEAAKVIENTQRDVNIALVNELALIFNKLDIDTLEVLEAAGSKWNFLPFRPGLVGGHCISVDPYYLTHKAQAIGYHPEVILSGRRINDGMGSHVAESVIKMMTQRRIPVVDSRILIMGLAFKENCPDIRNTRVIDIIEELHSYHANVDVYDPWVSSEDALASYDIQLTEQPKSAHYDAIILCVPHQQIKDMGADHIRSFGNTAHILYDVKYMFDKDSVDGRL
jgi:UDP-N-acetyl-D-galactosamine dehydrogenase